MICFCPILSQKSEVFLEHIVNNYDKLAQAKECGWVGQDSKKSAVDKFKLGKQRWTFLHKKE